MKFFGLTESDMPKALQPNFILDVEMSELFIQAGLQDRVIQVGLHAVISTYIRMYVLKNR